MIYQPIPDGKVCRHCQAWKPDNQLKRRKGSSRSVDTLCRQCGIAISGQWKKDHPERNREHSRKASRKHPANNPEHEREQNHRYYVKHRTKKAAYQKRRRLSMTDEARAKERERQRAYDAEHAEEIRVRKRRRRHAAPEVYRAITVRYRHRRRSLPNTFTAQDWQDCLTYWGNRCAVCGRESFPDIVLSTDHWIPLSSPDCPGTVRNNILPLCNGVSGCNNAKGSRNPQDWLIERLGPETAAQKLAEIETYFAAVSAAKA